MTCPFNITFHHTTGGVEELTLKNDSTNFQFTRKGFGVPVGMNYLDKQELVDGALHLSYLYFNDLHLSVTRSPCELGLIERYTFKNNSKNPITLNKEEYGIDVSFSDGTEIFEVALKRRLYVRVFDGDRTCVYTTRISGGTSIGLVVSDGEMGGYTKNKYSRYSDTVYTFYPKERELTQGEEYSFEWIIFPYSSMQEFRDIVGNYMTVPVFSTLTPSVNEQVNTSEARVLVDGEEGTSFIAREGGMITVEAYPADLYLKISRLDLLMKKREEFKRYIFRRKNPFDYLIKVRELLKSDDEKGIEEGIRLLHDYYKGVGKKRYDCFIPVEIIKRDPLLQEIVHEKCRILLGKQKGLFTPYRLLASYHYLLMEKELGKEYTEKLEELKELCDYYLETPFGRIDLKDDMLTLFTVDF